MDMMTWGRLSHRSFNPISSSGLPSLVSVNFLSGTVHSWQLDWSELVHTFLLYLLESVKKRKGNNECDDPSSHGNWRELKQMIFKNCFYSQVATAKIFFFFSNTIFKNYLQKQEFCNSNSVIHKNLIYFSSFLHWLYHLESQFRIIFSHLFPFDKVWTL